MKKNFLLSDVQVGKKFFALASKATKKKFAGPFDSKFFALLSKSNSRFAEFLKESSTLGKCYGFALLLSQFVPNCTLVHGVLKNLNKSVGDVYFEPFEHAWVEYDNLIFDTTSKCWFDRNKYYKLYDVEIYQKFSQEDLKDEQTLVKLAKNAINTHWDMQQPLFSFSPFTELQDKILDGQQPNFHFS